MYMGENMLNLLYETGVNNYQPMPVEGEIGDSILSRIEEYTQALQ